MSSAKEQRVTTEQESREVAEQARQTEWEGRAFIRELYLGSLPLDLVHPFPTEDAERPPDERDRPGDTDGQAVAAER